MQYAIILTTDELATILRQHFRNALNADVPSISVESYGKPRIEIVFEDPSKTAGKISCSEFTHRFGDVL